MNGSGVLKLIDLMKKFDVTSYPIIFTNSRRLERLTFFSYVGSVFIIMLLKVSYPFVPISDAEYEHVQTIYGYKYPQNRLPQCWVIPYVDLSVPRWFIPLYLSQLYFIPLFLVNATVILLFPFILLHLVGQHIVLSYKLMSLGKSPIGIHSRHSRSHQKIREAREKFELKKCIHIHQQLLHFRALYDSVTRKQIDLRVLILFSTVCISSFSITILSRFNLDKQCFLLAEFILIFGYYYFSCMISEILEWANCRIRRSAYNSAWYEMCPEAQRMMLMLIRRTQKPHYTRSLAGIVVLCNESFVKSLKTVYTFIRFVNLANK
ncbi:hypothetical protein WDU94_011574 [Cyamophila willieti]